MYLVISQFFCLPNSFHSTSEKGNFESIKMKVKIIEKEISLRIKIVFCDIVQINIYCVDQNILCRSAYIV